MIINYSRRFTFIHCPKTAGSSVAVYLARYLGHLDLQIGVWEDCVAAGIKPNLRFYLDIFAPTRIGSTLARMDLSITALSASQKKRYRSALGVKPTHAFAEDIRAFDPTAWDRNFKFCFVRNPYGRAVSYYGWTELNRTAAGRPRRTFREFLNAFAEAKPTDGLVPDAWPMYTIDDKVSVDFVGRFERLSEDMKMICGEIGIPFDQDAFPHAKRGKGEAYRDFYGPEERRIVDWLSGREIEAFGYAF